MRSAKPRHTVRAMTTSPLIGITVDSEEPGAYSNKPWFALRQNYCSAVTKAGGTVLMLPHDLDAAERYADVLDGLVISGGNFDIDPALFGATQRHATVKTKDQRTAFEAAVTRAMLARDKAVLGICGGQQLLHVILGGTLVQHIPDAVPDALVHEQPNSRDEPGHTVAVAPGTLLHAIVGADELPVNSAHHQAAAHDGEGIVINATASDGVVEGIESAAYRFCLGVQWHPEYDISDGDAKIFRAFVAAAGPR